MGKPIQYNIGVTNIGPVGPSYTGKQGLSSSVEPMEVTGNLKNYTTSVNDLPQKLGAFNDHADNVSIYPKSEMSFSEYQSLLNQIPSRKCKPRAPFD